MLGRWRWNRGIEVRWRLSSGQVGGLVDDDRTVGCEGEGQRAVREAEAQGGKCVRCNRDWARLRRRGHRTRREEVQGTQDGTGRSAEATHVSRDCSASLRRAAGGPLGTRAHNVQAAKRRRTRLRSIRNRPGCRNFSNRHIHFSTSLASITPTRALQGRHQPQAFRPEPLRPFAAPRSCLLTTPTAPSRTSHPPTAALLSNGICHPCHLPRPGKEVLLHSRNLTMLPAVRALPPPPAQTPPALHERN